jgi:stage V sporulation protein R
VDEAKTQGECLYLQHQFESKPLVKEYIPNTLLGISYLWGGPVELETTELVEEKQEASPVYYYGPQADQSQKEPSYRRVVYTMRDRKISRTVL